MNYKIVPEFMRGMLVYNVYVAVPEDSTNVSVQINWVLKRSFITPRAAQEYVQELNAYGEKK